MKKEKKELAKLALTGLLLAATLPAGMQAEVNNAKESYLAVATCGGEGKCSRSVGDSHSCRGKTSNPYAGGEVADADNFSVPPGSSSGSMNRSRPTGNNTYDGTGARTTGGSYANPDDPYLQGNRGTNNPSGK